MSPTASSCWGTNCTTPPRTALISMPSLILLSSSNALALRPSITTVSTTEMAMATRMPTHSAQSKCPPWMTLTTFTATVISQAKKSRMSIGSVDASQMRRSSDLRPVRVNSLRPYRSMFSRTCASLRPCAASVFNSASVCSAERSKKVILP